MNYMKDVAQLLGVELGEEFGIVNGYYKYRITELGVEYYDESNQCWTEGNYKLAWLLTGSVEVIKLPKPILDDKEKEYLSHIIKPLCDIVECIAKHEYTDEYEYINIIYIDPSFGRCSIEFPCFEKGTMYKGMKVNKQYTLEELGL